MLSVWGLKHGKSCCAPTNLCGPGLYDDARNILLSLQDLELLEILSSKAFKITYGFIGPLNLGYHFAVGFHICGTVPLANSQMSSHVCSGFTCHVSFQQRCDLHPYLVKTSEE